MKHYALFRNKWIRNVLGFFRRGQHVAKYLSRKCYQSIVWLFSSRETTNFTYDLTNLGKQFIVEGIAVAANRNRQELQHFVEELLNDSNLKDHVISRSQISKGSEFADLFFRPGKRIGWYILVRALKPRVVVETGIDKGLGSVIICAALLRNKAEGFTGKYYGTDINPDAGYLLSGEYSSVGTILYGDSIESLRLLEEKIDIFINDSDHSSDYEWREYEAIQSKIDENSIIIGDNCHVTSKLIEFAIRTDRHFLFIPEVPLNHWYPGGGIGVAFSRVK